MSLFTVNLPAECAEGRSCKNSISTLGQGRAHCVECRLAPDNEHIKYQQWRPLTSRDRHPVLDREKLEKSRAKAQAAVAKRQGVDRKRRTVLEQAVRSEAAVCKAALEATKNSGRSNRDGDWKAAGFVTLDNKDQSQRIHPVVNLAELEKVRKDAKRAGNQIGGLVLRNKHGVGVTVFDETDFFRVLGYIVEDGSGKSKAR